METKNKNSIISPFQGKKESMFEIDIRNPKHPARAEIDKVLGVYEITATFNEDADTLSQFSSIKGLVAIKCILEMDGEIIGEGRGTAVFSKVNKYIEKTVSVAVKAAFIDAVVRCTKLQETFKPGDVEWSEDIEDAYEAKAVYEGRQTITDKQKKFLTELVQTKVNDEEERNGWLNQMTQLTKGEASEAIESFLG
jgi:hypothetical protein